MRISATAALILSLASSAASAQIEMMWGRDYTFERMVATRVVRDAHDSGPIKLVTYVYRPLKNDRREVVLYSHGSTGARSPKDPIGTPPPIQIVNFFLSRGYTVVAPLRRGRSESTGAFVEECSEYANPCTDAEQAVITDRSIKEALLDTTAVIDQLVLGRIVARNSKILAAGHSRGGFLSLMLAGERPQVVKGVINFSGGWRIVSSQVEEAVRRERMRTQTESLARAAKRTTVPSIWLYAARDPFYAEGTPQELVKAWLDAGGKAEFIYLTDHSLENAHALPSSPILWARPLDAFLKIAGP
ncbi:MAG TPA: alpha/beta fold hydrolase [Thermoanaerobaculia bacterium]|nr:alpha/beta fold hydrolase [Thermoanaerobaculia bacterium]